MNRAPLILGKKNIFISEELGLATNSNFQMPISWKPDSENL